MTIFVAGLEGVFYAMIPITFMDGATVFEWNRVVWIAVFGLATFLFWHLLLNQNDSYLDATAPDARRRRARPGLLTGAMTPGRGCSSSSGSGRGSGAAPATA